MRIILNILSKEGPSATNTTKMRIKKIFKKKKIVCLPLEYVC